MYSILSGIRVLDLSRYIAGPLCSQILADMGAEVIKVEKVGGGDEARKCGPWKNGASLYFSAYNRNKKSISIDFRSKEGQDVLKKLAAKSDVIVENFKAGTMAKMGLGYEELKKINPGIILVSITGFGQTGPDSMRPAYDQIISYRSHLYQKVANDQFILGPDLMSDTIAGMNAATSAILALYDRLNTNQGQWVDFCMLSSSVAAQPIALADYAMNGENELYFIDAPNGVFQTKDGWVAITAGPQPMFMRIREVIDSDVVKDEKYLDVKNRINDNHLLCEEITQWTKSLTCKEIDNMLMEKGITGGVVNKWEDVLRDQHLIAREHYIQLPVKNAGTVPYSKFPAKFSAHKYVQDSPAPELGADNETVFSEILGMSSEEIQRFTCRCETNDKTT